MLVRLLMRLDRRCRVRCGASRKRSYEAEIDRYLQAEGFVLDREVTRALPLDSVPRRHRLAAIGPAVVHRQGRLRCRPRPGPAPRGGAARQPGLATRLEARIAVAAGIRQARASAITGNVLVALRRRDARSAVRLIAAVARHAPGGRTAQRSTARRAARRHHLAHADRRAVAERLRTRAVEQGSRRGRSRAAAGRTSGQQPARRRRRRLRSRSSAGHLTSLPGAAARRRPPRCRWARGALVDAVVIGAWSAPTRVVGYVTERRVERILASLQNATMPPGARPRDGQESWCRPRELVPGDVMILEAGHDDRRPTRGSSSVDASGVDESALTGESMPVREGRVARAARRRAAADRVNMVFAGTVVAEGSGLAVVIGTGRDTEIGRIRALVAETPTPPTPLERQLDAGGRARRRSRSGFCGARARPRAAARRAADRDGCAPPSRSPSPRCPRGCRRSPRRRSRSGCTG